MDTTHFNTLTDNILNDQSTYKQLKKDPTNSLQKEHKNFLNQLRDSNEIGPTLHKKLITSHPKPPYARATIKIHKDPVKARLLVCPRDTVHYNTAQHLARLLAPLGKTAKSFVKDSSEFCKKILDIPQPGTLISYDVVDLFTNVPRDEAMEIIRTRVEEILPSLDTRLTTDSIIRLIHSCISSTYFTWKDTFYQQTHGLPMGSPLSPLFTEIFMTHLEEKALETSPITPLCWFRKVDDTFAILHPNNDPRTILDHLNSQNPRMQFTMAEETNRQLPFLDVFVQKDKNDKLQTTVYREPTHTDQYLHYASNHPPQVKKGMVSTLARRAHNICSTKQHLTTQLSQLKQVFTQHNCYPEQLVQQTIKNITKKSQKSPRPQSAPFVISLPYFGIVSHKIQRLLKKQANIDVVFKRSHTIQNTIKATGKPPSSHKPEPSGAVYHIPCNCGQAYIGETSRPLKTRIKEHQSSVTKDDSKSALSDHIRDNPSHSIQW
ncbi:uncharacterized protein LOC125380886 [Haliotis rufescens]|uniref:uncharacterized protein LOC125380886 n=2 Tax=Haliotis rufescens TaxID=6454 RepID=UPI00201F64A6|nr:uncharacterized protein LOC125380886 [Haliotis rufescens]